jgi:hypothetical protein
MFKLTQMKLRNFIKDPSLREFYADAWGFISAATWRHSCKSHMKLSGLNVIQPNSICI